MPTDRPIIFSGPMVRALLDQRKSQTRRLATSPLRKCEPGDRLWVRETWSHTGEGVWSIANARAAMTGNAIYSVSHEGVQPLGWWPSIHMPREFSRLTLIVEAVRVEPLQAISERDAIAEGTQEPSLRDLSDDLAQAAWSERQVYQRLWCHLHGADSWDANPDVLVLTFRVVKANIDRIERIAA